MNRVDEKVAVVTGGTQGLGKAISLNFAKMGAKGIVILGRNQKRGEEVAKLIQQEINCETHFFKTELSDVNNCREAISFTLEKFSQIDILVNAAGLTDRGNIVETSEELFDKMIGTNVKGPFFLIQDAVKDMIKKETKGSIVNIGSQAAITGQPFLASYSLSKGALATLTKNTAFALLNNNIRVNQLNIGWMASDGEHQIQTKFHDAPDNWLEDAAKEQPFKRLLGTEEVAKAVTFLASEDSGMMTGSVIDFDQSVVGGYPFSPPKPPGKLELS
jgi:NAD(P)-dependent dehydrogenase (short-subunit alcohol dehydrogenase family)